MSIVTVNDNHLKDIADTIRSKDETENTYKPSEMAGAINKLVRDDYYIDGSIAKDIDTNYLLNRLIVRIPYIDTSNMTNFSYAFQRCSAMVELQEIDAGNIVNVNQAFASCSSLSKMGGLKNLGMGFPTNSDENTANCTLNLTSCPLDYPSAMNILNGLADIKSLGIATQTIRFKSSTFALLSDSDKAIGINKGWNVTT